MRCGVITAQNALRLPLGAAAAVAAAAAAGGVAEWDYTHTRTCVDAPARSVLPREASSVGDAAAATAANVRSARRWWPHAYGVLSAEFDLSTVTVVRLLQLLLEHTEEVATAARTCKAKDDKRGSPCATAPVLPATTTLALVATINTICRRNTVGIGYGRLVCARTGVRIIPDYQDAHVSASEETVVLDAQRMLAQLRLDVGAFLQKL